MFWLTARDAKIYPWENDLHLQCDYFDFQAVELDSTSLALCFSHRWSIHPPNIYWVPTIARLRARYLGEEKGELQGWISPCLCPWVSLGRQICKCTMIVWGMWKTQTITYYRSQIMSFSSLVTLVVTHTRLYCLRVSSWVVIYYLSTTKAATTSWMLPWLNSGWWIEEVAFVYWAHSCQTKPTKDRKHFLNAAAFIPLVTTPPCAQASQSTFISKIESGLGNNLWREAISFRENLGDLPKATQLVSGRTRSLTQFFSSWNLSCLAHHATLVIYCTHFTFSFGFHGMIG